MTFREVVFATVSSNRSLLPVTPTSTSNHLCKTLPAQSRSIEITQLDLTFKRIAFPQIGRDLLQRNRLAHKQHNQLQSKAQTCSTGKQFIRQNFLLVLFEALLKRA